MSKHDIGRGAKSRAPPRRAAARGGRSAAAERGAPRPQEAPPPRRRSVASRLAGEVKRLESELAAARARIAELAVRADIDPLTEVLNRRGFERELRRSLLFRSRRPQVDQ
jgi:hypothetical protein